MDVNTLSGMVFALLASLAGSVAASDFYGVVGYGQSQVKGKVPEPKERTYEAMDQKVTLGTTAEVDGKSRVTQLGLGYTFSRYLSVEAAYWRGFNARVRYSGDVGINDKPFITVTADHFAEMDGFELSLVPTLPITERYSLTGRLGAFQAKMRESISSSLFPDGYSIALEPERKSLPIVGIGLRYQITDGSSLAIERVGVNQKFVLWTLTARFRF